MHSRRTTTVSHTAVCAMVDLGKQPARWPCLLRLASPYDVELLRSTLVARPAVHRNLLSRLRAIAAQIPRKRRQCRTLAPLAREAVVATWATILAGQHCVHQSTNITFSCRLTAPRSMAGGSLIDPRPSRPSSSMYRRPSDGSWSLALADAWRCPASAEASSEAIDGVGFRCPNRLGAARAFRLW